MITHYGLWALFLLSTQAFATTYSSDAFENSAIVRVIELGAALGHTRTTYSVKSLDGESTTYAIAMGEKEYERTSFIEAKVKGKPKPLQLPPVTYSPESKAYFYEVTLPKPAARNTSVQLEVETVLTHAIYPWPASIGQDDEMLLKFESDLFVISPYHTVVQRSKVRAPNPNIISWEEPDNISAFTLDTPVTRSGATLTYGPYNNIPPSANAEFIAKTQTGITVQYTADMAIIEVTKLKRAAEVSHWGANLNIQDEIYLHNGGALLKGHFSRLSHQLQSFYQRPAAHIIRGLALQLPPGIHDAYYYDIVGNVSTSKLRVAPSIPKGSTPKQHSILELRPRYPLMGGWNYSFTLGWDSSLADSASYDASQNRYVLAVPNMTPMPGAVIDETEIKIILPEGATDYEVFPPVPPKSITHSTHTTYLDSIGRPAITLEYSQLTDRQYGIIYVTYKVPFTAHLRKPVAVASAFFALFLVALVARRIDMRIQK